MPASDLQAFYITTLQGASGLSPGPQQDRSKAWTQSGPGGRDGDGKRRQRAAAGVNPAFWLFQGFSIAAQNCNSLNVVSSNKNQDLKISAIEGYKADIILLSDVRLNGRDRTITDKIKLTYKMYHNSSSTANLSLCTVLSTTSFPSPLTKHGSETVTEILGSTSAMLKNSTLNRQITPLLKDYPSSPSHLYGTKKIHPSLPLNKNNT